MKLITLDRCAEITVSLFNEYTEPLAVSFMSGQVPSVFLGVHRHGTKEKDWLPRMQLKNTLAISVLHCDVYLDDIFRLCRMCRLWLVTEGVFRTTVLYSMIYSLFQCQTETGGASVMARAGKQTYEFMTVFYHPAASEEPTVLEILKYYMMIFTNNTWGDGNAADELQECQYLYQLLMLRTYPSAYKMARYRKACTNLVDADGYIVLEPKTAGYTACTQDEEKKDLAELTKSVKREKKKKAYTIEAETKPVTKSKRPERSDGYLTLNEKQQ